ncbi:MAG: hypothetical protein PWQ91_995, partial [Eubacteriales bacterium]|nr:hypothetical protein [Eubacteriales bacterium]
EREAFFEDGEVKEGRREAELVVIEADGVYIPLQQPSLLLWRRY